MQYPLSEQNFRHHTSLLEGGYAVTIELGDLVQDKQVWRDQVLRVTVVNGSGETKWDLFRGAHSLLNAKKWLDKTTDGVVKSF